MNTARSITANEFNIERGNYYPFGMEQPGRSYSSNSYRYGFNGMEKDDEIDGVSGSKLDFGARIYDSRLGRFLALDPKMSSFPSESPFIISGNNPIYYIDVNGLFKIKVTKAAQEKHGVTEQQLVRANEVLNNIQTYLNSEVGKGTLAVLSRQTGFSKSQILSDAVPGSGPTISAASDEQSGYWGANVSEDDAKNNQMHFDISLLLDFENTEFASDDEKALAYIKLLALVIHEYTHLGDRITNDGNITGTEETGDGKQKSKSVFNHRGTDVDYTIFRTKNTSIEYEDDDDGNRNWKFSTDSDKEVKYKMKKHGSYNEIKKIVSE